MDSTAIREDRQAWSHPGGEIGSVEAGPDGTGAPWPEAGKVPAGVASYPPLLTGGLQHLGKCLIGKGVDGLALTIGDSVAKANMLARTWLNEVGYPVRGFKKSENRDCMGGTCWRKLSPVVKSNDWGLEYECWEWMGSVSEVAARECRADRVKPTREDTAFDFQVADDFLSDDFVELVREHVEGKGLVIGITGQGKVNTRYIGAMESLRRIRIYRKDLRDAAWAEIYGPTLRVELVLKDEAAVAWWGVWAKSEDDAFAAAAAHILDMTGFNVGSRIGQVPQIVMPEETGVAMKLVSILKQYGGVLVSYEDAGVDVMGQARYFLERESRSSVCRRRKRTAKIQSFGARNVEALVKLLRPGGIGGEDATPGLDALDGRKPVLEEDTFPI